MSQDIITVFTIIGILITFFKSLFELIKEYQTNEKALSQLWANHRSRKFILIALIALLLLIVVLCWMLTPKSVLTVQIWNVELDTKQEIIATTNFIYAGDSRLPDEKVKEIGDWIIEQIYPKNALNDSDNSIQVHVYVPADLSGEIIKITSSEVINKYFWMVGENGKSSQIPFNANDHIDLNKNFTIVINKPGYITVQIPITPGHIFDKNFTLVTEPKGIIVGIEEFTGERNSVAAQLADYMSHDPRFSVKDPGTLEELKNEIERNKEIIKDYPAIQENLRETLGIDFIISGNIDKNSLE